MFVNYNTLFTMILSFLKPNESIKISSKSFSQISEKLRETVLLLKEAQNGHVQNGSSLKTEISISEFNPLMKKKIVYEMKEYKHKEDTLPENIKNEPFSKISLAEKYDKNTLKDIKQGIKRYLEFNEKALKYSEECNQRLLKEWNETVIIGILFLILRLN